MSERRNGVVPLLIVAAAVAAGLAVLVLLVIGKGAVGDGAFLGQQAPAFSLADLDGQPVDLDSLRGKVVFVNFWATWCAPCREEAPSLQKLYARLQPRGFEVVAVSIDPANQEKAVRSFVDEFDLEFPILADPDQRAYRSYGVTGVPETFLIDAEGRLAEKFIGPRDWSQPRFARAIERLLETASTDGASSDGGVDG